MLRARAVRSLLVEEVAGLLVAVPEADPDPPAGEPGGEAAAGTGSEAAAIELERDALARAGRRALFFVVLDFAAVAVLFASRPAIAFLTLGPSEEGVFTLGVLAVVAHAGYRLAQYRQFRTLSRLHAELAEREG